MSGVLCSRYDWICKVLRNRLVLNVTYVIELRNIKLVCCMYLLISLIK